MAVVLLLALLVSNKDGYLGRTRLAGGHWGNPSSSIAKRLRAARRELVPGQHSHGSAVVGRSHTITKFMEDIYRRRSSTQAC